MHIFIDTNILLSFFHFTSEDLNSLNNVFVSHKKGAASLHLTEQVRDEFHRNRETKITDALTRFKDAASALQVPTFMRTLPEFEKLEKASKSLQKSHAELLGTANKSILERTLAADLLIEGMFKKSKLLKASATIYTNARMRVDIGNPPGKNGSLGDAINWLLLLDSVPNEEDLYIVSDDKDYYSIIDKEKINPFLDDEWRRTKKSSVVCYRSLSAFLKDHFAGMTLSFDPEKKELIDALSNCGSFAATHAVVAKLDEFPSFSLLEVKAILDAANVNSQFGWIVTDGDVKSFIQKAIAPHKKHLKEAHYQEIINSVEADDA